MTVVKRSVNGVTVFHTIDGIDQLNGQGAEREHQARAIFAKPWPLVLLPIKLLAKPGDRGAGDIIGRAIGPVGGDAFKIWYKRLFGKTCGCGNRQETLNARWPL